MDIFIYGCGAFALAIANVLNDNGNNVLLYCRDEARAKSLNSTHIENKYFDNLKLNENIKFTSDVSKIKDFQTIIIAVPSKSIKDIIDVFNLYLSGKKVLIINATKGLEPSTNSRILDFLRKKLSSNIDYKLCSILGPGFAKNILNHDLTCINSVSSDLEVAKFVQTLFSNSYFRVYALTDEAGAEYSSSIKNAIAIASGILYGLGYKENSRSALITRGLSELVRFGTRFNAKKETFFGLTGVGDLILTASSKESRNFSFGEKVGKDNSALKALNENEKTVEGLNVVKVVYKIAKENNIDMPIIFALYNILFEYKKPSDVVKETMLRPLKLETF